MGTRADFYVGRGKDAEWIGSVAWDGYPDGFERTLFEQRTQKSWRRAVEIMLAGREDGTRPEQGWPWPWDDSRTTDYAYAFDRGRIWASDFGHGWFDPLKPEPEDRGNKSVVFPNMKSKQNVTLGKRSGVIVVSPRGIEDNLP